MSQMVTRKRTGGDEKEKRTDSPVKDMKKKMAANAEKEKNAVENKPEKSEKPAEKPSDKATDKSNDKSAEKPKASDKGPEKNVEKKDANEKKKEDVSNGESSGKQEKPEQKKPDTRSKQNGNTNGVNGTVSADSDSEELVIDEPDEADELFPELAYDDSDVEWEPSDAQSRSLTRRSQVKATRTPETPRPASGRPETGDESKDFKVLRHNPEGKTDTPKPDTKKAEAKDTKKPETPSKDTKNDAKKDDKEAKGDAKNVDSTKKDTEGIKKSVEGSKKNAEGTKKSVEGAKKSVEESKKDVEGTKKIVEGSKKDAEGTKKDKEEKSDKVEVEVIVEVESTEPVEESRKPDTNFSKSRVKVSPYRRSMRIADQTFSSVAANYTGNNTTMEMDLTETSSMMEQTLDDSYLSGLRSIRGRRSYKPLKEITLVNRSANRSVLSNNSGIVPETTPRPTGTVVGRKRKPEVDISIAMEAEEFPVANKRQRLLDRLARPFRSALLPARRNAEIVGINTDLPLTSPVASTSTMDPESLKPEASSTPVAPATPPVGLSTPEENKRCVIM